MVCLIILPEPKGCGNRIKLAFNQIAGFPTARLGQDLELLFLLSTMVLTPHGLGSTGFFWNATGFGLPANMRDFQAQHR
jgi:hypothetical protein